MESSLGTLLRKAIPVVGILLSLAQVTAAELFYTAYSNGGVSRVNEATGEMGPIIAPGVENGQGFSDFVGLAFGPDRSLYVSARSYFDSRSRGWDVFRFNPTNGQLFGTIVDNGPLYHITFGPVGDLFGVSGSRGSLGRYDGRTGQFKSRILNGDDFGYYGVGAFTFLPDGALFAITRSNEVARYNPETGERIGPVTSLIDLGLESYRFDGMAVGPDGNVYVAYDYSGRDQVLDGGIIRFDGTTGSPLDIFVDDIPAFGAASGGALGVAFGPEGDLYVGSQYASAILRYDPSTGALLGSLPLERGASYLAFLPVPEPNSFILIGLGCALLAILRRRQFNGKPH